jgi:hypothetical protein
LSQQDADADEGKTEDLNVTSRSKENVRVAIQVQAHGGLENLYQGTLTELHYPT